MTSRRRRTSPRPDGNKATRTQLALRNSKWHRLTVHVTTGATPHVDVWLYGSPFSITLEERRPRNGPVEAVQIGENLNRLFAGAVDNVKVSSKAIAPYLAPDPAPPPPATMPPLDGSHPH